MNDALPAALRKRILALFDGMRRFGVGISPAEEILAFEALLSVDLGDAEDFRLALRGALCRSQEGQVVFDRLYGSWLRGHDLVPDETKPAPPTESGQAGASERVPDTVTRGVPRGENARQRDEAVAERSRYSPAAGPTALTAGIADNAPAAALREADALLGSLRLGLGRRYRAGEGPRLDLRRSLHASLSSQGEILRLQRRRRKPRPPRVILLCDGSRSMEAESAGILRLGRALVRRSRRAEVFLFSTQLRRVTRQLRSARATAPALTALGEGYGGGTRIGFSLRTLLREYGRLLSRDSVVLIASDGLDTGDVAVLGWAMAEIRARCSYVFWLNPLAGTHGFAPLQRGMQAALPYIDLLWDMHDPHVLTHLGRRVREGRLPA